MIQQALPNPEMTQNGFGKIADQFQAVNDMHVAKQELAQQWRSSHSGTLDGFEAAFNESISPSAFLAHRMSAPDLAAMAANLQKTPEGRTALAHLQRELQVGQQLGIFEGQ